jgi:hypothetical protein
VWPVRRRIHSSLRPFAGSANCAWTLGIAFAGIGLRSMSFAGYSASCRTCRITWAVMTALAGAGSFPGDDALHEASAPSQALRVELRGQSEGLVDTVGLPCLVQAVDEILDLLGAGSCVLERGVRRQEHGAPFLRCDGDAREELATFESTTLCDAGRVTALRSRCQHVIGSDVSMRGSVVVRPRRNRIPPCRQCFH